MSTYKFEIYEDKAGEFRWRMTASNGNIIGASSEGYSSHKSCKDNAISLAKALTEATAGDSK